MTRPAREDVEHLIGGVDTPHDSREVLVVASRDELYRVDPDGGAARLLERDIPGYITALAAHDGDIYDACANGPVRNTVTNEVVLAADAIEETVRAMTFHDGGLVYADGKTVYDAARDEQLAERPYVVNALVSHGDRLYDAGNYFEVYDTLDDDAVMDAPAKTNALAGLDGMELLAGVGEPSEVRERDVDAGVWSVARGERVAERDWPKALAVADGELYDADGKNVYHTLADETGDGPVHAFPDQTAYNIHDMAAVPVETVMRLNSTGSWRNMEPPEDDG